MTKILFICLGNICRSPMAEAMFSHLAAEVGRSDEFEVASAAVSEEEWGNPIYPPAAAILRRHGISYDTVRTARPMKKADYQYYRNVADPWYTRDFDTAYNDILLGCRALLKALPH